MTYFDKLSRYTKEQMGQEIIAVSKEAGYRHASIFLTTGGHTYTIEHVCSGVYLSGKKISPSLRKKLRILYALSKHDVSFAYDRLLNAAPGYFRGMSEKREYEERLRKAREYLEGVTE